MLINDNPEQIPMSLEEYKEMKIKMLTEDFYIRLDEEDLRHVRGLKSEIQVDQFCLSKIMNY